MTAERSRLSLSFDNGPFADVTPRVLDTLARYDLRATFFVCGNDRAVQDVPRPVRVALYQVAHRACQDDWLVAGDGEVEKIRRLLEGRRAVGDDNPARVVTRQQSADAAAEIDDSRRIYDVARDVRMLYRADFCDVGKLRNQGSEFLG